MSLRIAVIDSGVHAAHPHIGGVAGGVAILPNGEEASDYTDHLGHGTAVSAVIRQKAPDAEIWAVKIFHASLATNIVPLVRAIEWSVEHGMEMINLSLGTDNPAHREFLEIPVSRAIAGRCRIVAAGPPWLPGAIDGVIPVELDWDCPRDEYRARQDENGPRRLAREWLPETDSWGATGAQPQRTELRRRQRDRSVSAAPS